jgi:hypothetical protein
MRAVTSLCPGYSNQLKVTLFLVYEDSDFPYDNQRSSALNSVHCAGLLFMEI